MTASPSRSSASNRPTGFVDALADDVAHMLNQFNQELEQNARAGARDRSTFVDSIAARVNTLRDETARSLKEIRRDLEESANESARRRFEAVDAAARWVDQARRRSADFSKSVRRDLNRMAKEGQAARFAFLSDLLDWADDFSSRAARAHQAMANDLASAALESRRERVSFIRDLRARTHEMVAGMRDDRLAAADQLHAELDGFMQDLRSADLARRDGRDAPRRRTTSGARSSAQRPSRTTRAPRSGAVAATIARAGAAAPATMPEAIDFRAQLAGDAPGLRDQRRPMRAGSGRR